MVKSCSAIREMARSYRLDLAFSRDQAHKIYVQHRILKMPRSFGAWLQKGAYFYVCGDAKRMAKDVHQTLIAIAQKEGDLSPEAAAEYVKCDADEDRKALSARCVLNGELI